MQQDTTNLLHWMERVTRQINNGRSAESLQAEQAYFNQRYAEEAYRAS